MKISCNRCGGRIEPVCGPALVLCENGHHIHDIPAGVCIGRDGAGWTIGGCSLCGPTGVPRQLSAADFGASEDADDNTAAMQACIDACTDGKVSGR